MYITKKNAALFKCHDEHTKNIYDNIIMYTKIPNDEAFF